MYQYCSSHIINQHKCTQANTQATKETALAWCTTRMAGVRYDQSIKAWNQQIVWTKKWTTKSVSIEKSLSSQSLSLKLSTDAMFPQPQGGAVEERQTSRAGVWIFEKITTKHRSIKKFSSDLGFLHNSLEIFIFKRPKTKVLRHSKNATVLEIWLDQGIYTGEKIFSFWIFFAYNGIERVGMTIKMITGGSSGDLPEGKGSIEFFDEVLLITWIGREVL